MKLRKEFPNHIFFRIHRAHYKDLQMNSLYVLTDIVLKRTGSSDLRQFTYMFQSREARIMVNVSLGLKVLKYCSVPLLF